MAFSAIEGLARVGFLVKGVLYLVVGMLALQVAVRIGGRVTGSRGALMTVLAQPFGRTLLLVAAIGLLGYAAWRIVQGIFDSERAGHNWQGLVLRSRFVVRGVMHGALGWQAFRLYGGLSPRSGATEREATTKVLEWPLGDWVVVLVGVSVIGYAVQQVYAAVTGQLERNLNVGRLRRDAGEWAVAVSRFGVAARAVVLGLLGWTLVVAGLARDPSEVGSTALSLRTLAEQPGALGQWLLGITAVGLVAYGFYEIIHAQTPSTFAPVP